MKASGLRAMISNRLNRSKIYNKSDYWNAKAAEYSGDAISMWPNNHLNRYYHNEQLKFFDRVAPELNGLNVLDVGCGTGRMTRHISQRGASATGIDFAEKVVEIAKQQAEGANPQYEVCSVFEINHEGDFDLITLWGCLTVACSNSDELLDVMQRLHRALKPGGRIILLEPIHGTFLHRVLKLGTKRFCRIMEQAGFQIRGVTPLHFWPSRLALAYIRWPRWLTAVGYYVGQGIMRLLGNHRALGDYKAIEAIRPADDHSTTIPPSSQP
ncbi:MAG: methyltransferase domain-containing protein [Phycisphaeraceae bacterium]